MNTNLDVTQLVLQIISTIVVIYLAFVAAQFAAKPKVDIRFKNGKKEFEVQAGEKATLKLQLENKGHWFSKPAARKLALFVNFEPVFEPIEVRYGSALEISNREVMTGTGGRKYLKVEDEIYLYHGDPGEDVQVDVKTPETEGRYLVEVAAYSQEGSCGLHRLWLRVIKSTA